MLGRNLLRRWCQTPLYVRHLCSAEVKGPVALRSLKPKSSRNQVKHLVDVKRVRAVGGDGGNGCVSFLQLWANEKAGPDGGDGGNGAHIVLQASSDVRGLHHVTTVVKADSGERGYNKNCHGKNAQHKVVKVPVGTIIRDSEGRTVGDLKESGSMYVLARGGAGGHGNRFFATDTEQRPQVAEYGARGEDISYVLELRSMAHFGLVGMPNAGKSTLLQAISRARPKVASYPFTTLKPHLGMVHYDDLFQLAVADLPGLIEGSHRNRGLGIDFLRHAERCTGLVVVVDVSQEPLHALRILTHELHAFNPGLASRPCIVVANKLDIPHATECLDKIRENMEGIEVIGISAKFGTNVSVLLQRLRQIYDTFTNENDKH